MTARFPQLRVVPHCRPRVPSHVLTLRINQMLQGDAHAEAQVYEELIADLQGMAKKMLDRGAPGSELSPGGLVNEAYLRVKTSMPKRFRDPGQFLLFFSDAMRRTVLDHMRFSS